MPWEKVIMAALFAFMAYRWIPKDEDCLLVLVEAEDTLSHRYHRGFLGPFRRNSTTNLNNLRNLVTDIG